MLPITEKIGCAREIRGIAADQHDQLVGLRLRRAAGYRRIQHGDARLGAGPGELQGGAGRDRAYVDQQAAGTRAGDGPLRIVHRLFERAVVGHRDQDGVALGGERLRAVEVAHDVPLPGRGRFGDGGEDDVAGLGEPIAHAARHGAIADGADLCSGHGYLRQARLRTRRTGSATGSGTGSACGSRWAKKRPVWLAGSAATVSGVPTATI